MAKQMPAKRRCLQLMLLTPALPEEEWRLEMSVFRSLMELVEPPAAFPYLAQPLENKLYEDRH